MVLPNHLQFSILPSRVEREQQAVAEMESLPPLTLLPPLSPPPSRYGLDEHPNAIPRPCPDCLRQWRVEQVPPVRCENSKSYLSGYIVCAWCGHFYGFEDVDE